MEASDAWSRRFVQRNSLVVTILFGVVFTGMGLVFAVMGGMMLASGQNTWLFLLVGLLFAVVGPVIAWYNYYYGESVEIDCGPHGFSVTRESRSEGKRQETYAWNDITSTAYNETYTRSSRSSSMNHGGSSSRTTTTRHFTVETTRGQAFHVTGSIGDFAGLIELVNRATPHLPYVWTPQFGYNFSIGPIRGGRMAYAQTARNAEPAVPPASAAVTAGQGGVAPGPGAPAGAFAGAPPFVPPAPGSGQNVFGLIGLIVSVLSLPVCGILAPLGLLLSVVGLFRPKKGLAIAGSVIGLVGTCLLLFIGYSAATGVQAAGKILQVEQVLDDAKQKIEEHRSTEGSLPDSGTGNLLILGCIDPYGKCLRYRRVADDRFELRCFGPDGVADTPDDTAHEYDGNGLPVEAILEDSGPPAEPGLR